MQTALHEIDSQPTHGWCHVAASPVQLTTPLHLVGAVSPGAEQKLSRQGYFTFKEDIMAKYGKAAGKSVKSAMHREKRGTLKSGKGGKGGKVTSRKQAIAIGLSEARKKGAKVPAKK